MAERCVCCGEIIPEGRQVCPNCEKGELTMEDRREQLIKLLKDSEAAYAKFVHETSYMPDKAKFTADHLIANGVTLDNQVSSSKWTPVTERLPREEWEHFTEENDWDVYPCLAVVKTSRGGRYVTKMFYTGENFVDDEYVRYTAQVTHWMPLPEPPKGE